MNFLGNLGGGGNMLWLLVLVLILGGDDGCINCDSIIWILLLSRFCGGDSCPGVNNGCGCPNTGNIRNCGC